MTTRLKLLQILIILCMVLSAARTRADESVLPTDSRIKYVGAWQTDGTYRYTVYGGSQFRIRFQGQVVLDFLPISGYLKIRQIGQDSGAVSTIGRDIVLTSSSGVTEYEINYMAQLDPYFFPSSPYYQSARLTLESITLTSGSTLYSATDPAGDLILEFVGDSITEGHRILNGYGNYPDSMDATLGFAYLTARAMDSFYRIRGYGGESVADLGGKIPYFLYQLPLESTPEPDFVFINIGANNRSMSGSDYEVYLRNVMNAVTTTFPNSTMILLSFFNNNPDRRPYMQSALSQAPGRAEFFDAVSYLTGYTDGIHPDAASHQALSEALAEFLTAEPVPGDYDGDGKCDIATYLSPRSGQWHIMYSTNSTSSKQYFGWSDAIAVPGDYDGDGKTDTAVFSPSDGMWYIMQSRDGYTSRQFGWSETTPVPADYDGDGKCDIAVYWQPGGYWYVLRSSEGYTAQQFGWADTSAYPADYDGDGKTDITVYWPGGGNWYMLLSRDGYVVNQFGWSETTPYPADYDGDGVDDLAVFHPQTGNWYIYQSGSGFRTQQFGWAQSTPVPGDYDGDGTDDLAVFGSRKYWYILQSTDGYVVRTIQ